MLWTKNPRTMITPQSFDVAPELLGTPLAGSGRRLSAILLDLFFLALFLGLAEAPGVLFALTLSAILFRITTGPGEGHVVARWGKRGLRLVASVLVFLGVLALWQRGEDMIEADERPSASRVEWTDQVTFDLEDFGLTPVQAGLALNDLRKLQSAKDSAEQARMADRFVERLRSGKADEDVIARLKTALVDGEIELGDSSRTLAVLGSMNRAFPAVAPFTPKEWSDTVAVAYVEALRAEDGAALELLQPQLAAEIAADTLDELLDDNERLEKQVAQLREQRSPVGMIREAVDELGIGFGWSALYFTAFLALFRGQTPGKRLVGIRVIRLNGKPMSWWIAFERFGGYSASIVTGLLGFAQILWDRNRQALHDKLVETVVVRVGQPNQLETLAASRAAAGTATAVPAGASEPETD